MISNFREQLNAYQRLLDGLHGWLASPCSFLHDPALLRKVHTYMAKALKLLVTVLRKNGCTPIHANFNRVIFATGKMRVVPDVVNFWQTLRDNLSKEKVLEPLGLDGESITELFYGMLWHDKVNWAGVPIDNDSG